MSLTFIILGLICLPFGFSVAAQDQNTKPKSPYLDQDPPGMQPEVFAPGLISLEDQRELNAVFSPKMGIFMFSRTINDTFKMFYTSRDRNGNWRQPQMAGPSKTFPNHRDVDMAFSPDGKWLYFISDRPLKGYSLDRYNIWRSRITGEGLLDPEPLSAEINGPGHEFYPVLVADGSLYFTAKRPDSFGLNDSYRAQFNGEGFDKPVNLGPTVNTKYNEGDIYVSPDESYMIHVSSGRPDSLGSGDLYVSFKEADGSWGKDIHMGPVINSDQLDYCPMVSPDGNYLFFTRGDDIMWVDAKIIDSFRP